MNLIYKFEEKLCVWFLLKFSHALKTKSFNAELSKSETNFAIIFVPFTLKHGSIESLLITYNVSCALILFH